MKAYKRTGFLFSMLAILFSCSQQGDKYPNAIRFSYNDFKTTQHLEGAELQFDDNVLRPVRLLVQDTLLITINSGDQKLFSVFDLRSKKRIGDRISRGQGPTDMMYPSFMGVDKEHIRFFDGFKSAWLEYALGEFVYEPDPTPLRGATLNEKLYGGEANMMGDQLITSINNPETRFYIFNEEGKRIGEFGDFPITEREYSNSEKMSGYQVDFDTNGSDKIVVCYKMTDLIEIYNKEGKVEKRLHGPDHFFSYVEEVRDGEITMARIVKGKTKDAYFNPQSVGEELFVLYSGKTVEDFPDMLCQQILVFGWDGTPKKILTLDTGIFTFTVDAKNKKIYGISDTPDFHIVEFSYE